MSRMLQGLADRRVLFSLFAVVALVVTWHALTLGPRTYSPGGTQYTVYNNYVIFKSSFHHLVSHQDLYTEYVDEHWDRFKYTPTFALLFAPFAVLPDGLGLLLWNLLNALALAWAIQALPLLGARQKGLILVLLLVESITSLQNSQSNGLIAGLIVGAFCAMERGRAALATLLLVLSIFIKPFGLAAMLLFLMYPGFRRTIAWTAAWTLLFAMAPLLVLSWPEFVHHHGDWLALLASDHAASTGYSVMGWLASWFHWQPDKRALLAVGLLVLLAPYARIAAYGDPVFRRLQLAMVLIWMVIFNHMAESPTFIIAMTGVVIAYMSVTRGWPEHLLLASALLLTSLSPTDLFPRTILNEWVKPYALKAVPCILIAAWLVVTLLRWRTLTRMDPDRA